MSKNERIRKFGIIQTLADEKGVKLSAVAKDLGFHVALFSDWKSGKSMPKADKLIKIANYFDIPLEKLIA